MNNQQASNKDNMEFSTENVQIIMCEYTTLIYKIIQQYDSLANEYDSLAKKHGVLMEDNKILSDEYRTIALKNDRLINRINILEVDNQNLLGLRKKILFSGGIYAPIYGVKILYHSIRDYGFKNTIKKIISKFVKNK